MGGEMRLRLAIVPLIQAYALLFCVFACLEDTEDVSKDGLVIRILLLFFFCCLLKATA
jgi:hypothetical protein